MIALELVKIHWLPLAIVCAAGEVFHGDGRSGITMKAELKLISIAITFADAAHEIGDLLHCSVKAFFKNSEDFSVVGACWQAEEEIRSHVVSGSDLVDL
jgi:hypothetical protein